MEWCLLAKVDALQQTGGQEVVAFFRSRLSFIDVVVSFLGVFVLLYQGWVRLGNTSGRFLRRARDDRLFLEKTALKLRFIGTLIETLPLLGILGTVWGLMKALIFLRVLDAPTIGDIAIHIAPALSTTFLGLAFAVVNLFFFGYLETYLNELSAWFEIYHGEHSPPEAEGDGGEATG